jgi:hypothetical protein
MSRIAGLGRDRKGNIAIITALALPVLLGCFSLGFETAFWSQTQRSMQNAADSAAEAAATNGGSSYAAEAKAVTSAYGLTDGSGNVSVTVSNTASCPGGGSNCYSVTITKKVPLFVAQVAGYHGDATLNGSSAKLLTATAIAKPGTQQREYCLLALATSGADGINANGVPYADLHGCNTMSNTNAVCSGHDLNAGYGDAHLTNTGCGANSENGVPTVADPYASLVNNVPANPCSSYPQEPVKKHDPALPSSNVFSGSVSWSGNKFICGDMQLTGDLTITGNPAVLVIENGQLDTNGFTIKSDTGAGVTIIFSGDNSSGYTHGPTGGGTLDISSPTSGSWKGVAVYQDPRLTSGIDLSAAGNAPTWDISGLVYLPHSSVTFSGAVNKSSNGYSCFAMVVDNVTVNGTADIFGGNSQCAQQGLTMPVNQVGGRGILVS